MHLGEKDRQELETHIRSHMTYPANKQAIIEQCNRMAHVPQATRQWVTDSLADRSYQSAEDVIHALNLPHEH